MLAGQMTKTRSLEKFWADFWVRGSGMQKVEFGANVGFKINKNL